MDSENRPVTLADLKEVIDNVTQTLYKRFDRIEQVQTEHTALLKQHTATLEQHTAWHQETLALLRDVRAELRDLTARVTSMERDVRLMNTHLEAMVGELKGIRSQLEGLRREAEERVDALGMRTTEIQKELSLIGREHDQLQQRVVALEETFLQAAAA
jgi:chromosome segregation ATPase